MWRILLDEFIGDLRTQKVRAFLTMLAVAWGTLAVVLMLSFGEGLKRQALAGMVNAYDNILLVYGGTTSKPWQGMPQGRRIRLTLEDTDLLRRSIPEIDMIGPSFGRGGVALEAGDVRTTTYMEGVTPAFEEMRSMYPVAGGRFINMLDVGQKRRVLFLGDSIAGRLFPGEDPIGRGVSLDGLPFTVVGVMRSKLQSSTSNGPDSERAIIPASTFQAIYGARHIWRMHVRPRDLAQSAAVESQVYEVLSRKYKFDPEDSRALSVWDTVEDAKISRRIGLGIQIFLGVVGGLTLIVAGVGVANVMYVTVRERTREIGVKLAIGARKRHIVAQFVFEALLVAFTGGVVGLGVAAAIVLGVDSIPSTNEALAYLANPKLSWPIGIITVGILTGIGLLAGLFPARRAAAVDPVESLRYE